ncbi:hypothetical protein CANARDRAFT_6358 [[Candida] arabinofermentans NRRL YB-2248]|uniref:Protein kinase domain-containing protein n=1 Tax=[Candida] arabinofermentans NRRL YB-2248 TaxID=983967 RepID=A0A1E4T545_9ASCO|nr:hypothetical protein CANARDRAFT_6358 [[Candida] arabinofermentans NRRL YB-2248]
MASNTNKISITKSDDSEQPEAEKISLSTSPTSLRPRRSTLKLNLQSLTTTPVLLSPRGTPKSSPNPTGAFSFDQMSKIRDDVNNNNAGDFSGNTVTPLDEILAGNTGPMYNVEPKDPSTNSSVHTPPDPPPSVPMFHSSQKVPPLQPLTLTGAKSHTNSIINRNEGNPVIPKASQSAQRATRTLSNYQKLRTALASTDSGTPNVQQDQNQQAQLQKDQLKQNQQDTLSGGLSEAVRPHTSILRSNLNTKYTQQYQQQEKMYLNGITKFKNRYRVNDDYYNKSVDVVDDDDAVDATVEDEYDVAKGPEKMDQDLLTQSDEGQISTDESKELQALRALSQQIGMIDNEWEKPSEYTLDSNVLLDLLNKSEDIQLKHTDANAAIVERLEWQSMLQSVLTGDVVTGEKTKLIKPFSEVEGENYLRVSYNEDLWLGIRAKLYGRTEEDQKRLVLYHRGLVDETLEEIMNLRLVVPDNIKSLSYADQVKFASEKVNCLLQKYERCQELWRTNKEMENEKPQCGTPEFVSRINALVAWTSVASAIERESNVLKKWVGNDELDISRSPASASSSTASFENTTAESSEAVNGNGKNGNILKDDRSFVERIMKEKDIEDVFDKRLFTSFSHWTFKAKESYLQYQQLFENLGLPSYVNNLFVLAMFPTKLMKELIRARLAYARKMKNPTMMMIDQVLSDFQLYITLALEIRTSFIEYCAPREGWISLPDYQDTEFDNAILECVHHYLFLLNRKLLDSPKTSKSFRTFKEPEELEKQWSFLQNLGFYLEGGSAEIATQFSILNSKLTIRLNHYIHQQTQGPPYDGTPLDKHKMVRWYSSTMENFGQLKRKFMRFNLLLNQYFQNSLLYNLNGSKMKKFLENLKDSNHVLYHSPSLANEGIYIFVSESLASKPFEVARILKSTHLGVDFSKIPKRHLDAVNNYNYHIDSLNDNPYSYNDIVRYNSGFDYVLLVYPSKAMMWDGTVIPFDIENLPIENIEKGKVLLLSKGGPDSSLDECGKWFKECVGETLGGVLSKRCSLSQVQRELQTTSKQFFRMSCFAIGSFTSIRNQCRGISDCQELVNNVAMYLKDLGRDSIRGLDTVRRSAIVLKMLYLAIEWLSFVVDDCVPTDPKTFRWCVAALEFAMDITRGFNILTLDGEKFYRLKEKVAGCMSLLISHFDIMGARTKELQKRRMMNYRSISGKDLFTMDDESLGSLREHIMYQVGKLEEERRHLQVEQQSVGRVLDDKDTENQFLTYLASSFSSVSIRWQKGKFLGGGTFGSVYASINLDTGGAMAVKEIRFQDRQSIKTVVPAIKGEMTVLEMLSHPNIVQFFGVEVHRDRVYIFMEYCSGGSLASLLEYGRIEDETVIQLYTLQMLEGLAYLHQFGIVHRDIKPENILLDHMGVIKFVDFGSSKVIAMAAQRTASKSVTSSSNSTGTNGSASGSMTVSVSGDSVSPSQSMLSDILHPARKTHVTGTPMYMSPEVIKGENPGKFGSIDIWSLGCCILEMATGRRPWTNLDNEFAVMYHIAAGHLPQFPTPDQLSQQGQDFLTKCLNTDPNKRLSAVELLKDPWIQAIRNEAFSDSQNSTVIDSTDA